METDPEKAARVLKLFTLVDQGHAVSYACRETGISRGHAGFILKNLAYIARRVMADDTVVEARGARRALSR